MAHSSFKNSELFKALPFHTSGFLDNNEAINDFKLVEPRLAVGETLFLERIH